MSGILRKGDTNNIVSNVKWCVIPVLEGTFPGPVNAFYFQQRGFYYVVGLFTLLLCVGAAQFSCLLIPSIKM